MARPQETYWLWVGGAFTTLGAACMGARAPLIPVCVALGAAALCVVCARLGIGFPPFARRFRWHGIRRRADINDPLMAVEAPDESEPGDLRSEIEENMERNRVPINESPAKLCRTGKSLTSAQKQSVRELYYGLWLRVDGPVSDVGPWDKSYCRVTLKREFRGSTVQLRFTDEWVFHNRLAVLGKRSGITVIGRITEITDVSVILTNCEIESVWRP
jgi:hypothetical protein